MTCYQLLYISHPRTENLEVELLAILNHAQSINYQLRISGLLVYHQNLFMQLLEGEEITVKNLFTKIQQDSRHNNICVLVETNSLHRSFSTWAMGFGTSHGLSPLFSEQSFNFSIDDIKEICSGLQGKVGEKINQFLIS
jgi:hypothetical protein